MAEAMLVADIGGTNARFALADCSEGNISIRSVQRFRAEDFESVRDVASAYLESVKEQPTRACFAVAAPVDGDDIAFTNSPWRLRRDDIKQSLGLRAFLVVNDFYALAAGVGHLDADSFAMVKPGAGDPSAPVLVIGPGTGLGQALIVPTRTGRKIIATEGGHVAFAPHAQQEFEIMKFIAREHPRVSVERLLSGGGLVNIHRALCARAGTPRISLQADEITAAALEGKPPIAVQAVNMFCEILGRVAGDAVLSTGARGGVVLGGGILPKIRDLLLSSRFVEGFLDKGRRRGYVEDVPARLIIRPGAALYGAASSAAEERA